MKIIYLSFLTMLFLASSCAPSEMEMEQLDFDKDSKKICECVKESKGDSKMTASCDRMAEELLIKWENKPRRSEGIKRRVDECLSGK